MNFICREKEIGKMHKFTIFIGLVAVLSFMPGSVSAKKFKGKWGGISSSTLEFFLGNKVQYCFKGDCQVLPYTGNRNKKVRFKWGSANFTFTKRGAGYSGRYQRGTDTSKINMK